MTDKDARIRELEEWIRMGIGALEDYGLYGGKRDPSAPADALLGRIYSIKSRLALLEKVVVDFDEEIRGDYHRDGTKIHVVVTQESLNKFRAALDALKEG